MKRKMTAMILSLSIFGGVSAYAAPDIKINMETVNVTAVTEPGAKAILYVVRADSDDDSDVLAMKQATADSNGYVRFSFGVPEFKNSESTEGEYKVIVKQTEGEMQTGNFFYASLNAREEVLSRMEKGELAEVINNPQNESALRALGIELDLYRSLGDSVKEEIVDTAEEIVRDKVAEYPEAVNYGVGIYFLNEDKESPSDTYISKLGLSFENTSYVEIRDEKLKNFVAEYLYGNREYDSYDEVRDAYAEVNALYIINGTRYTDMKKTITKYADILGIEDSDEYDDYKDLSSYEKADKKIAEILKKTPAETVSDLLDAMEKGVEAGSKKSSGGSSGGGGGGGGSFAPQGNSNVPGVSSAVPSEEENKVYFSDLSGVKWAEDAIYGLAEKGIVAGDGDGKFYPDRALTREEFVKMIVVASNAHDKTAECNFTDVTKDKWYYSYVASAFENKMVNGISETEFGSGKFLTRQDMAVMCCRGIKGVKQPGNVREYTGFADEDSISAYAKEDVKTLYMWGAVNGVDGGCFDPMGFATRAQAAVIIYNLFK